MGDVEDDAPNSPEVHFYPVVELPLVEPKTCEENEEELIKLRARLFRYDATDQPPQWKERGTGEVKILRHTTKDSCRIVMRRDKTLKICANHYIQPFMKLQPSPGSDKAFIWSTPADFADEEPKTEMLAIRFANAEIAQKFKTTFEEAKFSISSALEAKDDITSSKPDKEGSEEITSKLLKLTVKEGDRGSKDAGSGDSIVQHGGAGADEDVTQENNGKEMKKEDHPQETTDLKEN